jgi:hypothetical protein
MKYIALKTQIAEIAADDETIEHLIYDPTGPAKLFILFCTTCMKNTMFTKQPHGIYLQITKYRCGICGKDMLKSSNPWVYLVEDPPKEVYNCPEVYADIYSKVDHQVAFRNGRRL